MSGESPKLVGSFTEEELLDFHRSASSALENGDLEWMANIVFEILETIQDRNPADGEKNAEL